MVHAENGTKPTAQPIRPPISEVRAVEAAIARLIPADELRPGAKEAGVAVFLDSQLAGAWGSGDHLYRHGPFAAGLRRRIF
jgi:hypothetical protein